MLLRQTVLYLPAQLLGPIFQLISVFAWTHVLSPTDMGTFALVNAAQELAFTVTLSWFSLYIVRYFDAAAEPVDRNRFHATESLVLLAGSLVTASAFLVVPIGGGVALTGPLLVSATAFAVTRALVSYLADRARTQHDTLTYTVLQSGGPVGGFFAGLTLVSIFAPSATVVLAGYALAQLASLALAACRLTFGWNPQLASRDILRSALTYGLPLLVGGLLVWVAANGVRYLVEWKDGIAAVGLVTVGWALGLRAAQFAAMLTTAAAFPLAVKRARESGLAAGQAQLIDNGILLLAVLAPAVVGLYVIGPPLIALIVAADYRAITTAVLPMALATGALRAFRVHFTNQVFLLNEAPRIVVLNDGLDAALTLILGGLGLWLGGILGCVGGVTLGAAVTLAIGTVAAARTYRFAFPLNALFRIAAATVLMALSVLAFAPTASPLALTLAIALGSAVYAAALAILFPAHARRTASLLQSLFGRAALPGLAPLPRPQPNEPAP
jgi:O-antigen/teichoic acid export membrane protein